MNKQTKIIYQYYDYIYDIHYYILLNLSYTNNLYVNNIITKLLLLNVWERKVVSVLINRSG